MKRVILSLDDAGSVSLEVQDLYEGVPSTKSLTSQLNTPRGLAI
jgi:hypothetical protein